MLAKLDTKQEKAGADKEEIEADRKAWRENIAAETEAIKARTKVMRENMSISHKEIVAESKPKMDIKTIACRETMEAHLEEVAMACQKMEVRLEEEELTSMDRKPMAPEQEVPVEDATLKTVKGRKKRHRGKKQIAGQHEEPKELTREDCGSRMMLGAAYRKASISCPLSW
jgi:hypothetical protein